MNIIPRPSQVKVIIIGGGLSAIYSFWGAIDAGYTAEEIQVITPNKFINPGAIFMYKSPIPWSPVAVNSILLGTPEGYALKQWGDPEVETSVNRRFKDVKDYVTEYLYDPEQLSVTLWGLIPLTTKIDSFLPPEYIKILASQTDAVICTFSDRETRAEYIDNNTLSTFPVYSTKCSDNTYNVIYNGLGYVPWIRQTTMSGRMFVEYPRGTDPQMISDYELYRDNGGGTITNVPDLAPNSKVLTALDRTNVNIFRVGRFSAFDPKYLSHQAQEETYLFLRSLQ